MIYLEQYGRFGNNVQQLLHAIHVAKTQGHSKIRFLFPGFGKQELVLGPRIPGEKTVTSTCFSFPTEAEYPTWSQCKDYAALVKPLVLREPPSFTNEQLSQDLFVHIRGGDVFGPSPHNLYVQPPLAYYLAIFSKHVNLRVHLICEDIRNPVVGALEKRGYPVYLLPLKQTIAVFLHAAHIVAGFGTFVPALSLLGNPTCLYVPAHETCRMVSPGAIRASIPNYIPVGEWRGSEEQRQFMLTYNDEVSF
jgi:hypothetical protein